MPTLPPRPIEEPKDEMERMARIGAVIFMEKLLQCFEDYAYSTRSNIPGKMDYTDLSGSISQTLKFAKARPDWTLSILNRVMTECSPNYAQQIETDKLKKMLDKFESESGLKLDEYVYNNAKPFAEAVKTVMAAKSPNRAIDIAIQDMERLARKLGQSQKRVLDIIAEVKT